MGMVWSHLGFREIPHGSWGMDLRLWRTSARSGGAAPGAGVAEPRGCTGQDSGRAALPQAQAERRRWVWGPSTSDHEQGKTGYLTDWSQPDLDCQLEGRMWNQNGSRGS